MASEKMTVEQILTIVGFTAIAIAVVVNANTLVHVLLYREVLSVHFFLYLAMWVSVPCLLLVWVKKYRKKAVIPPMIACGLSTIFYFFAFLDMEEMIYIQEALICLVIFGISYVLYAYFSQLKERERSES